MCCPEPIFVGSFATGSARHTADFLISHSEQVIKNTTILGGRGFAAIDGICTDDPSVNRLYRRVLKEKWPHLLGTWSCAPHSLHNLVKDVLQNEEFKKVRHRI